MIATARTTWRAASSPSAAAGRSSAEARPVLKDLTRADLPRLVVLSHREIPRDTPVEDLGTVDAEERVSVLSSVATTY